MKISKQFTFEASHQLVGHEGKCANLHGHSYKLEVIIEGGLTTQGSSEGMVVDFSHVKERVKPLLDVIDHSFIAQGNESFTVDTKVTKLGVRTTAEHLSLFFLFYLKSLCNLPVINVKLWETATGYAEASLDDLTKYSDLKDKFMKVKFSEYDTDKDIFDIYNIKEED